MRKHNNRVWVLSYMILLVVLSACASQMLPPNERWVRDYKFMDNNVQQKKEKENIKIALSLINEKEMNKYPELFRFKPIHWGLEWQPILKWKKGVIQVGGDDLSKSLYFWFPPDSAMSYYAFTFLGMPAFFVSVENSTGHILRMNDARIYLIIEGIEPIPAIYSFGKTEFVQTKMKLNENEVKIEITKSSQERDESLLDYITRYEVQLRKEFSHPQYANYPPYPIGLLGRVAVENLQAHNLINEVGREILPGFSLNGILCFPHFMKPNQQAKVIFYDVTTKTDEAGNPTKKTQFEFEFKYEPKYMKYVRDKFKWEMTTIP